MAKSTRAEKMWRPTWPNRNVGIIFRLELT
jgi:hypothetical protein